MSLLKSALIAGLTTSALVLRTSSERGGWLRNGGVCVWENGRKIYEPSENAEFSQTQATLKDESGFNEGSQNAKPLQEAQNAQSSEPRGYARVEALRQKLIEKRKGGA